jgi:hypothetical protein
MKPVPESLTDIDETNRCMDIRGSIGILDGITSRIILRNGQKSHDYDT